MFRELVECLTELGVKARGPKIIKPDAEPPNRYMVACQDGTFVKMKADPPFRGHVIRCLEDLLALSQHLVAVESMAFRPTVWYDREGVCLMDDRDRCDDANLVLALSPQIRLLGSLAEKRSQYKQAELIRLFRIDLKGCLGPTGSLVEVLRKVKFAVGESGESSVQHGKSSVGRALSAELTGMGALPEYVMLDVPVFSSTLLYRECVECALEPLAESQTFLLIPLPGEIEKAIERAEDRLGKALADLFAESGVPVFYGRP